VIENLPSKALGSHLSTEKKKKKKKERFVLVQDYRAHGGMEKAYSPYDI
jgi:hypothetical protein